MTHYYPAIFPTMAKGKETKSDKKKTGDDSDAKGSQSKLKPATSINVRHILCEKHSRKETALEALNNGQSFDAVAREYSEDKARQGGSLGWKVRGSLLQDFEKVAYDLQPSTTNKPIIGEVKTSEGYRKSSRRVEHQSPLTGHRYYHGGRAQVEAV